MSNTSNSELMDAVQVAVTTGLPKYCSLQNYSNSEYRCSRATHLVKPKDYSSPECLMKLVRSGENLYAIRNEKNKEYFQNTIGTMSGDITSDDQLWTILPYPGIPNGYTIQNKENSKYMTSSAGSLHKGNPGTKEVWIIQSRPPIIQEILANSYYGSLQNEANKEYRTNYASQLSGSMVIPNTLFKMVLLNNGLYGIQNQDNYEFFQSTIRTMTKDIEGSGQEWNIAAVNGAEANIYTIQNAANGEYMTSAAGSLYDAKKTPPGKEQYWKIAKYPYTETASWMGDSWSLLANKPLNKICIPGSHDSGTYNPRELTAFGTVDNTKTQIFDIQMQLMQGIRMFDLRPTLHRGMFFTYHASNVAGKIQGAIGEKMEQIFAQVRAFASNPAHKRELIILDFSHAMRWSYLGYESALTPNQRQQFIELVKSELSDLLICRKATQLTELTCSELVSNGRNVLCLFAGNEFATTAPETELGIWNKSYFRTKGSYSSTNDLAEMIYTKTGTENQSQLIQLKESDRSLPANKESFMFELCWQLTLSGVESTVPFLFSILAMAKQANAALYPTLTDWMSEKTINKTTYPNIINTDACQESATKVVKLCIEITGFIQ